MEPLLACLGYRQPQREIAVPQTASRSSCHGEEYAVIWARRIGRIASASDESYPRRGAKSP